MSFFLSLVFRLYDVSGVDTTLCRLVGDFLQPRQNAVEFQLEKKIIICNFYVLRFSVRVGLFYFAADRVQNTHTIG